MIYDWTFAILTAAWLVSFSYHCRRINCVLQFGIQILMASSIFPFSQSTPNKGRYLQLLDRTLQWQLTDKQAAWELGEVLSVCGFSSQLRVFFSSRSLGWAQYGWHHGLMDRNGTLRTENLQKQLCSRRAVLGSIRVVDRIVAHSFNCADLNGIIQRLPKWLNRSVSWSVCLRPSPHPKVIFSCTSGWGRVGKLHHMTQKLFTWSKTLQGLQREASTTTT